MDITSILFLLVLAGALLGAALASAFWLVRFAYHRDKALQDQRIHDLEQRAKIMDEAACRNRKHYSYDALASIYDALSLLVHDAVMDEAEYNARKARRETALAKIQGLLDVLKRKE